MLIDIAQKIHSTTHHARKTKARNVGVDIDRFEKGQPRMSCMIEMSTISRTIKATHFADARMAI